MNYRRLLVLTVLFVMFILPSAFCYDIDVTEYLLPTELVSHEIPVTQFPPRVAEAVCIFDSQQMTGDIFLQITVLKNGNIEVDHKLEKQGMDQFTDTNKDLGGGTVYLGNDSDVQIERGKLRFRW